MPAWRGRIGGDRVRDLVDFVRTFGPPNLSTANPATSDFAVRFRQLSKQWDELDEQVPGPLARRPVRPYCPRSEVDFHPGAEVRSPRKRTALVAVPRRLDPSSREACVCTDVKVMDYFRSSPMSFPRMRWPQVLGSRGGNATATRRSRRNGPRVVEALEDRALMSMGGHASMSLDLDDHGAEDRRHTSFVQTNLVSDLAGLNPVTVDPGLVNPWGLAASPAGPWWVSDNNAGVSTIYNGNTAAKVPLTVTIPAPLHPDGRHADGHRVQPEHDGLPRLGPRHRGPLHLRHRGRHDRGLEFRHQRLDQGRQLVRPFGDRRRGLQGPGVGEYRHGELPLRHELPGRDRRRVR